MVEFFQAGGFAMFLVLGLSVATLAVAVMFAWAADERRMALLRALTTTTVFSAVTGVLTNLATVMYTAPQRPELTSQPHFERIIMIGIGESLTPAILGGSLLTVAWLIAAVGVRRLAARLEPLAAA